MTHSFTSLDDDEFNRLFRDFRYTAYRLETLQRYDVSYEQDEFARFLAGESRGEFPGIAAWCDTVRAAASAGKRMHRVHVVVEPLSDYVRFECGWAYEHTVEAGEDVRLIVVSGDDWPAGLPHYDYWLFDSSQLVAMYYDEAGRFVSGELISEPEKIVQANLWRDAAVAEAIPYRQCADQLQPSSP
ncbi:hypothetical protein ML5_4253 [Micromonospora sp. L5]|uniref:DUF6879 family protein n=1 Tax=Micromonospora TaxID=1873 RepID=UPI0001C46E7A|nr:MULTISPECIES: DUF6879 family protein [Micromonospora]ADU09753.1 hypothetical protein ML5_4253 [Micromonospora sp. L5]MBC9005201.1 hypothetical protein [Micromonospora aurantiaca]RBJ11679.1 hypothetical protein DRA43_00105 [Micromonospora provocatoris]